MALNLSGVGELCCNNFCLIVILAFFAFILVTYILSLIELHMKQKQIKYLKENPSTVKNISITEINGDFVEDLK